MVSRAVADMLYATSDQEDCRESYLPRNKVVTRKRATRGGKACCTISTSLSLRYQCPRAVIRFAPASAGKSRGRRRGRPGQASSEGYYFKIQSVCTSLAHVPTAQQPILAPCTCSLTPHDTRRRPSNTANDAAAAANHPARLSAAVAPVHTLTTHFRTTN